MIKLTKLNGKEIFINPHLLETMDSGGVETRLHFISGKILVVKENQKEVQTMIIAYRKSLGVLNQDL